MESKSAGLRAYSQNSATFPPTPFTISRKALARPSSRAPGKTDPLNLPLAPPRLPWPRSGDHCAIWEASGNSKAFEPRPPKLLSTWIRSVAPDLTLKQMDLGRGGEVGLRRKLVCGHLILVCNAN